MLFDFQHKPVRLQESSFYRWEKWAPEKFSDNEGGKMSDWQVTHGSGSQAQNTVKSEVLLHSWHCPASTGKRMYFQVLVEWGASSWVAGIPLWGSWALPSLCPPDRWSSPLTRASGCSGAGPWRRSLLSPLKCWPFSVFKKKLQVLAVVLVSLSDNLDI